MLRELAVRLLSPILRQPRIQPRWQRYREGQFDRRFHVDTAGFAELADVGASGANVAQGSRYEATAPAFFRWLMDRVAFDPQGYTFIDFGCGKGRALFIASEMEFRSIIGVEFGHALAEVAQANLKSYRNAAQRCRDLRVLEMDATQFDFPDTPLFCYFFNPFSVAIADQVLARLEASLRAHPRPAYVLWCMNERPALLDHHAFLQKMEESATPHRQYCLYRAGTI